MSNATVGENRASPDCCESCIGTGIGWNGPHSACPACYGRGVVRMPPPTSVEEPSGWNPDPDEEDDYAF